MSACLSRITFLTHALCPARRAQGKMRPQAADFLVDKISKLFWNNLNSNCFFHCINFYLSIALVKQVKVDDIYTTPILLLLPLPRTYAAWKASASLLALSSCAIRSCRLPATSLAAIPRWPSLAVKQAACAFTNRVEKYLRYWPRITRQSPAFQTLWPGKGPGTLPLQR